MSAIERMDHGGFLFKAGQYALVFLGSTVAAALYRYVEDLLGILWREQLTESMSDAYMSDRVYYHLDGAMGVANPDQRITEDVKAFTTTTLSFMLLILNGSITAIAFSGVLWSISPQLFAVAVAYAVIGSMITILLGKPLVRLNYHQYDLEANYRAELIHVRENSESIALAHRENRFKSRLGSGLGALTENFRRLIRVNRNVAFFTNGYNYFIQIIPAFLIAPKFMAGEIEFGVITQSTMAFATLLGAFSLIVTQFQSISAFTAVTARLHMLTDAIEKTREADMCAIDVAETHDEIVFEHVTLRSVDQTRVLIEDLNLTIRPGERLLVTCEHDEPKVALFRATAGVWDCGGGTLRRPSLEDVLFLPERPYLPPGTLRNAVLRTGQEHLSSDEEIAAVLDHLGLSRTVLRVGGLDVERDWDDQLSIGEQHLFSVARMYLAKPSFVFLDRPGSSLPKALISTALEGLLESHVGIVVLAKNGESRLNFDRRLEIHPDGSWNLTQVRDSVREDELAKDDSLLSA
jgi:putative ATP-binding cassette transporter